MVPQPTTTRTLESLPPRPPTPPRESEPAEPEPEPRPRLLRRILSMGLGTKTPPNASPKSSAESASTTAGVSTPSDRSHKKVGWSIVDVADDGGAETPRALNQRTSLSNQILRSLPPSSDQKPPKSILKPYNGANLVNTRTAAGFAKDASPLTDQGFAVMLESVAKQLAGGDRMSRVDAYMSLSGVLKATENIPDPRALRDKMGLLAQFIQRDMGAVLASGAADTVLINNALILLASLFWKTEPLPTDFSVFVLEHAIAAFEDPMVSKDVAKHLMFVVGQQNFSPKIMTPDRAARVLKATHEVAEHVRGKSIVLGRLGIYRKLLKQAKPALVANNDWLKDMFEDMLVSVKEVRSPVIAFGFEAALQFGTQLKVSRAVVELFQAPHEKGGKYGNYYAGRLNAAIQAKQDVPSVPQIWSVVTLFLRSRPSQLEHWEFMTPWFQTLQKCFNSGDPEVKREANFAWNRLVFAIRPDEKTNPRFIKMLHQPFIGQLNRKNSSKQGKEMFQVTISSICNLLYYTLNPAASQVQLGLYWDAYVVPLIGKLATATGEQGADKGTPSMDGVEQAIEILRSLLEPSTQSSATPWKQDRAMAAELVKPSELPSLDSKWVRKNCVRVIDVMEQLLEQRFADLGKAQSPATELWRSFLMTVAAAGAKEIKVSNETMECVARIFTMLRRFWQKGPQPAKKNEAMDPAAYLDGMVYLITESVGVLGILPFTEKKLSVTEQNAFLAVATPSSHRLPKTIKSPLQYLIVLLVEAASDLQCSTTYKAAVRAILNPFYEARTSRTSRFEFCQDLVQCLPEAVRGTDISPAETVWGVLADMLAQAINETEDGHSHTTSSSANKQQEGDVLRGIVRVLEYGLTTVVSEGIPHLETLFRAASSYIKAEVGDGGHALCLVDPLARCLGDQLGRTDVRALAGMCAVLVGDACYPVDAHSLEAARRRLWAASTSSPKPATTDPYRYLYGTVNVYLEKCYEECSGDPASADALLAGATVLIERSPGAHSLDLFAAIGSGGACWIGDANAVVKSRSSTSKAIAALWEAIRSQASTAISGVDSTIALSKLNALLSAGLNSKRKPIANSAITLWNNTFGTQSTLSYPADVAKALARLRPVADLKLPNFPTTYDEAATPSGPQFIESDSDSQAMSFRLSSRPASRGVTPYLESSPLPSHRKTKSPHPSIEMAKSASKKRLSTSKRGKGKRDTTPRLRHEDSQIQFAAIESSPTADDSQLLTDRQREVKERQQEETAAMFPDLRKSPRMKTRRSGERLELSSDLPVVEATTWGTPSISRVAERDDDFITSSPTPRRGASEGVLGVGEEADGDVPSSPPKGDAEGGPSASDEFWNVTSFGSIDSLLLEQHALGLPEVVHGEVVEEDGRSDSSSILMQALPLPHNVEAHEQVDEPIHESTFSDALSNLDAIRERDDVTTDEVFVDAQSSPQLEAQADLPSAQSSGRRKRRRRNRRGSNADVSRGTSASASVADDSAQLPTEQNDEPPAEEVGGSAAFKRSLFLNPTSDLDGDSYAAVSASPQPSSVPEPETRKTRKRRRAAAVAAEEEQSTPATAPRSMRSMRSSDKLARAAVSDEPAAPEQEEEASIPTRTRSHARKREIASTIPESPIAAMSAPRETRRRKSPHGEDEDEDEEVMTRSQSAKRQRVDREREEVRNSHVSPEPTTENTEAIVIDTTPRSRRSRRERTSTAKWEESDLGRRRRRSRATADDEEAEAEAEAESQMRQSRRSIDLDAPSAEVVEDSFVKFEEGMEGQEDVSMHGAGEGGVQEAQREGVASDEEAEAQIWDGMAEVREALVGAADRASADAVSMEPEVVVESTPAAEAEAEAKKEFTGATAVAMFKELMEGLKTGTVSRVEAMQMEEMVWDFKAELYAAERRGRGSAASAPLLPSIPLSSSLSGFGLALPRYNNNHGHHHPTFPYTTFPTSASTTTTIKLLAYTTYTSLQRGSRQIALRFVLDTTQRDKAIQINPSYPQPPPPHLQPNIAAMSSTRPKPNNLSLSATPAQPAASATITHDNGRVTATLPTGESVEVLLYGATVVSWKDKGGEKLWVSEGADLSGGSAVRGGVPLVFPVFGKSTDHPATAALPQHGFARTSRWEFLGKSTTESDGKGGDGGVKLDFGLGPENLSAEAREAWKGEFGLIYSVALTRGALRTSMLVRNDGGEAWDFQVLMHTYLRVKDITTTTVEGLAGAPYFDKVTASTSTAPASPAALSITGETDRVYTPASVETTLTVSANGTPAFEIVRENFENVVVWNPWEEKAKGIKDFAPKDGWKEMLCVEAGQVAGWTKLEGGDAWEGGVTIKALL
ncbi:hypothetical protein V496_05649 [Pseudogymnoascus sp. VKM F-4515 (FW-2607)]|nr:hypothetical protein V496_05649 [Pseudogymnoascus sp. VKM F-4515 (FW-2607)]